MLADPEPVRQRFERLWRRACRTGVLREELSQILAALPDSAELLVGGAAAEKYASVCAAVGARLVRIDDWPEIFS